MSEESIIHISGISGTILAVVSFMPQVYTTYKTQNVDGLSPWFIILTIVGSLAWITYAYYMESWHQFVANFICLILAIVLMILYISCKNKEMMKGDDKKK